MLKDNIKRTIKIGDVFFASAKDLDTWHLYDDDTVDFIAPRTISILDEDKIEEDMLFVFKYIGKGKCVEMLTEEEVYLENNEGLEIEDYNKNDYESYKVVKVEREYTPEQIEEWELDTKLIKKEVSARENLANLFDKINFIPNHPLLYFPNSNIYEINDETKLEYLKYSDSSRTTTLGYAKVCAEEESKKAYDIIKYSLDKYQEKFYQETIEDVMDIANLDNQLFDFSNKTL